MLLGKERIDGRPHDGGYPTRGVVTDEWLHVESFEPTRCPSGNPETGYMACEAGKTKSVILHSHRRDANDPFWALCFGLRPPEEFYNLKSDPDCVQNLATLPNFATQKTKLHDQMHSGLKAWRGLRPQPTESQLRRPAAKVYRIVAKSEVVVFRPEGPAVHIAWPSGPGKTPQNAL